MQAIGISLLTGVVGTGLGGGLGAIGREKSDKTIAAFSALSAGLMLGVVCFELLPHAMEISVCMGALGLGAGILLLLLLKSLIPSENASLHMGKLIGLGIALHNFPEGLAIGAGLIAAPQLGFHLALTIFLHDVPEGLAMALPLRKGGAGRWFTFLLSCLSGFPTVLGAGAGWLLGGVSPGALSLCLGLAGGAMLEITCRDIVPQFGGAGSGVYLLLGLLLGAAVCFFL